MNNRSWKCMKHVPLNENTVLALQKYFGKTPEIFQWFKQPVNLTANIGNFPAVFESVKCHCACSNHKYFGKIADIFRCYKRPVNLNTNIRYPPTFLTQWHVIAHVLTTNTRYFPVVQTTIEFNRKYRVFPRHFLPSDVWNAHVLTTNISVKYPIFLHAFRNTLWHCHFKPIIPDI